MFQNPDPSTGRSPNTMRRSMLPHGGETATQTIDLNSLWTSDVAMTGSFDLRGIESTSFGKLLDALPIPAFLVDKWHSVVFSNRACSKLNEDFAVEEGACFVDLVSRPDDPLRAEAVMDKTRSVLTRAFETRRPQRAETILEIAGKRMWCRLHFTSVRVGAQRQMLVLVEDLTSERIQQRLSKREEERLRRRIADLDAQVRNLTSELSAANGKLRLETAAHDKTKQSLQGLRIKRP